MIRCASLLLLLAFAGLGCRSVSVVSPRTAIIKVVDFSGSPVSGVELYAVYPVSSQTVRTATEVDGVGTMTFPPARKTAVLIDIYREKTNVGAVFIKFPTCGTEFYGVAEIGYYTELNADGTIGRRHKLTR